MMDCKYAGEWLSQAQDVRLGWRRRLGLRFHLLLCSACREFARQLALLRQAARAVSRLTENDPEVVLSDTARRRIGSAIAEAQQQPAHPD